MKGGIVFQHTTLPQVVCFGSGRAAANTAAAVSRLGASRLMTIAAASAAPLDSRISADLPVVHRHREVVQHVPGEVAERARERAAACRADAIVALGGGSAIGLAKAVALTTSLPVIAVPTTYAGSEATAVWGLTTNGEKVTGTDPRVLPRFVVYDAELTATLPTDLAVASGLNALAHSVDALWAPGANPVNAAFAAEGMRGLGAALPALADSPAPLEVREQMLYAAYVAATAFASSGPGLHHKICHVLGGLFGLPHAATHAVVLPHVVELNAPGAPDAAQRIGAALGHRDAVTAVRDLCATVGAPSSLSGLGMPEEGIASAARAVLPLVPAGNPVPVTHQTLQRLITRAWTGEEPR